MDRPRSSTDEAKAATSRRAKAIGTHKRVASDMVVAEGVCTAVVCMCLIFPVRSPVLFRIVECGLLLSCRRDVKAHFLDPSVTFLWNSFLSIYFFPFLSIPRKGLSTHSRRSKSPSERFTSVHCRGPLSV